MDFIYDLLGAMIAIWLVTRIIYIITDRKMKNKQQAGLSFVIGILLIIILMSIGWFSFEATIPYFIALFLWFILDFTEVTNVRKKKVEKKTS